MKKCFLLLMFSLQVFAEPKPLVVGTTSGYAPYVSLDAKGGYEGFDIDFAEELAKKLDRKLVIKDCGSMPGLLLALQQKKVDLVIWAMSITDERLKKIEMIYYQGEKVKELPFLFWKEVPESVQKIEDLAKERNWIISVEGESFQEKVLGKYPAVRYKQVEKITDAVLEIRFGKSKAATADPSLIAELKKKYPEIKVLNLPLNPEDYSLGNGVCINKTNQELAERVKKATEELISEGKIVELERKWNLGA